MHCHVVPNGEQLLDALCGMHGWHVDCLGDFMVIVKQVGLV